MKRNITMLLIVSLLLSVLAPALAYADNNDNNLLEYLGEESFIKSEEDDKYVIEFKEESILAAIERLNSRVTKDTEANFDRKIIIEVKGLEDFNIDYIFTGRTLNALEESHIYVDIKREEASINLDYETYRSMDIEDEDSISLNIDKIPNRVAVDKVRDQDAMKKAFNIYMTRTRNNHRERLYRLGKPIRIKEHIGSLNKDVLAFYNITNGMDFVTGKVKNNVITYEIKEFGQYALVETYFTFTDTKDYWGRYPIKHMTAKNVVSGLGNGLFQPKDDVTREQFAKMMVSALEIDVDKYSYTGDLKDVKKGSWSEPYITAAYQVGLIKGKEPGMFKPKDKITRQEMAAMLARLDKVNLSDEEVERELSKYKDRDTISNWARHDVAKASRLGIITGTGDGISPKENTNRGQAATTMERIYNMY